MISLVLTTVMTTSPQHRHHHHLVDDSLKIFKLAHLTIVLVRRYYCHCTIAATKAATTTTTTATTTTTTNENANLKIAIPFHQNSMKWFQTHLALKVHSHFKGLICHGTLIVEYEIVKSYLEYSAIDTYIETKIRIYFGDRMVSKTPFRIWFMPNENLINKNEQLFQENVNFLKQIKKQLQNTKRYPSLFVDSIHTYLILELYNAEQHRRNIVNNVVVDDDNDDHDNNTDMRYLIEMFAQFPEKQVNYQLMATNSEYLFKKMDQLYIQFNANQLHGQTPASLFQASMLEEKQQVALNAKSFQHSSHNKNNNDDDDEDDDNDEDDDVGEVPIINNINNNLEKNAKGFFATEKQHQQQQQQELHLMYAPLPDSAEDLEISNLSDKRYYFGKQIPTFVAQTKAKNGSRLVTYKISGIFTYNFLKKLTLTEAFMIPHALTEFNNPISVRTTIYFEKKNAITLFNCINSSDYENQRKECLIHWIYPLNLLKTDNIAYLKNAIRFEFMKFTRSHLPIPLNKSEENYFRISCIDWTRSLINNYKRFESNSSLSGPVTSIASTRPLEGATDSKALEKIYPVDTVVVSTIFNCQYMSPEDKIII